jgi:hypothetical protein
MQKRPGDLSGMTKRLSKAVWSFLQQKRECVILKPVIFFFRKDTCRYAYGQTIDAYLQSFQKSALALKLRPSTKVQENTLERSAVQSWEHIYRKESSRVVSCRVVSCQIKSSRVVSYRVVSNLLKSSRVELCRVVSCRIVSRRAVSNRVE